MGDIDWSSPPERKLPRHNRDKEEEAKFKRWGYAAMTMMLILVPFAMYGIYLVDGDAVRKEVIAEGISATLVNQRKDHCFRRSLKVWNFFARHGPGMVDRDQFRACILEGQ